jgi:hypothetical protein
MPAAVVGAGADEADAGRHPLDHARDVARGRAGLQRGDHEQRGAHAHQHVGADAGRLAAALALPAHRAAQEGGQHQLHGDAREPPRVGDIDAQVVEDRFHDASFGG